MSADKTIDSLLKETRVFPPLPFYDLRAGSTALLVVDMQYLDAHRDYGMGRTARDNGLTDELEPYFAAVDAIVRASLQEEIECGRHQRSLHRMSNRSLGRLFAGLGEMRGGGDGHVLDVARIHDRADGNVEKAKEHDIAVFFRAFAVVAKPVLRHHAEIAQEEMALGAGGQRSRCGRRRRRGRARPGSPRRPAASAAETSPASSRA